MSHPILKFAVLFALVFIPCVYGLAADRTDKFLALAKLPNATLTRDKVEGMCGKPERVQELRKACKWYYTNNDTKLVIQWNNKSGLAEKFSFNSQSKSRLAFDAALEHKLKADHLDVSDAMKLLGIPKDMLLKPTTQVMHYTYEKCVLRLFFRNRTLVDYALVGCFK